MILLLQECVPGLFLAVQRLSSTRFFAMGFAAVTEWAHRVNLAVARSPVGKHFRLEGSGHVCLQRHGSGCKKPD